MKTILEGGAFQAWKRFAGPLVLSATVATAMVTPQLRSFNAGELVKFKGIIIEHTGQTLKLRGDNDETGVIDLTDSTKVLLKHGLFNSGKTPMDINSLVPGLKVEAEGRGNDKGELVATRVNFDPNSLKAARAIDTRVSPLEGRATSLEGRAGQLESRAGTLENRAGQLENRAGQLETAEKQTEQQAAEAKAQADKANQGVDGVNSRVSDLDNYEAKYTATVLFAVNQATLTAGAKKDLDDLIQKAHNEKGYMIEVAGYADKTGNLAHNQTLSSMRANAVVQYLQEQGDIPLRRILAPAGLGTTHAVADNSTSQGRKLNRRVEVKVIVNRGMVASNAAPASPDKPASANP